ncbi:MAG: hypothetical protein ACK46Q_03905 [Hyphomonas sp.]
MRTLPLTLAAALLLAACASGNTEAQWTSRPGAQPFATAHTTCREVSYGIEANFITCMAGRGWVRR